MPFSRLSNEGLALATEAIDTTRKMPANAAGDFNVRFDRPYDLHKCQVLDYGEQFRVRQVLDDGHARHASQRSNDAAISGLPDHQLPEFYSQSAFTVR